jgi:hypothetical protein
MQYILYKYFSMKTGSLSLNAQKSFESFYKVIECCQNLRTWHNTAFRFLYDERRCVSLQMKQIQYKSYTNVYTYLQNMLECRLIIRKLVFRRRPRVEAYRQVMKVKHRTEVYSYTYFNFGMRTAYKFLLFDTDSTILNRLKIQRSLTFSDKLVLIIQCLHPI